MKAWRVEDLDEVRTIVFAETANKAKALSVRCIDIEYIDLRVTRAKWADNLAQKCGEIDWEDKETAKKLREQGWWYGDCPRYCAECGLAQYYGLEESYLDDDCVCGECRKKEG